MEKLFSVLAILFCLSFLTLAGCSKAKTNAKAPVRVKSPAQKAMYEQSMDAAAEAVKARSIP